MRWILLVALPLEILSGATVHAGVPDPSRSIIDLKGQVVPCHFRFRPDGGLDCMTVAITLRNAFDEPVGNELTSVTLLGATCSCCPRTQTGVSNALGAVAFEFKKIGGRNPLTVCVTTKTQGNIAIGCPGATYTSTDLNGDCLTDVFDIALWANCLPPGPYCTQSDYNCDGTVDVIDLGIFAGGLLVDCSDGPPCPP
jgi:hypothetical protein